MRLFLAALVACAYISSVQASLKDEEGHYNDLRQRLGHFRDDKIYLDLYKVYATAFVLPQHKERAHDDYRNYLPSGDECMVFFRRFRMDDYVPRDLDDFVVLDACLGYLYQSEYQEKDMASSETLRQNLDDYKNDEKLKAMWEHTGITTFPEGSKKCIANLLLKSVQAKKQYTKVVCNNHWLNIFNEFAACQSDMLKMRDGDSYLQMLYELVKKRANECFNNEIHLLNTAVRTEYINNPFSIMANKVSYWDTIRRQSGERYYPTKLAAVLKAVQGTTQQINIKEIANIVRGVGLDEPAFKNRLLNNLAKFADQEIKPNGWHIHKRTKGADDPTGVQRYDDLIDNTCNFFRSSDSENFYDFVTPFVRMITMLKYPEVFDISKQEFVEKVLTHSFETGALYLAVSSCNIMSFTEGQFVRQPQNKELHYMVVFKRNLNKMVQWPDVGYY